MSGFLGVVRIPIQRIEDGIVKIISGATVTVYNTLPSGNSPVSKDGTVDPSAVKSTIYSDHLSTIPKTNPLVSDAQGIIEFYAPAGMYHFAAVSPDGKTLGDSWYSHQAPAYEHVAQDYNSIQSAINAAGSNGNTIKLVGVNDITDYAPLILKRGTVLKGESCSGIGELTGGGPWNSATQIKCTDPNKRILDLSDAARCEIQDVQITGANASGSQVGIYANFSSPRTTLQGHIFKNVVVEKCGSHGIELYNCYLTTLNHVTCKDNKGSGMVVGVPAGGLTNPHYIFDHFWAYSNGLYGLSVSKVGPAIFRSCSFQGNAGTSQCEIIDSTGITMTECNWEEIEAGMYGIGLLMYRCASFSISGIFQRTDPGTGKAIQAAGCHHGEIGPITIQKMTQGIMLLSDSGIPSHDIGIGMVNIPNGEHVPLVAGTEGTANDYYNIFPRYVKQYANEAARDHAPAVGYESPLKVLNEEIFVRSPGTNPTQRSQKWNGSAWVSAGGY